jgi:anti-sigma factor RsiW
MQDMSKNPPLSERDEADLAALADGRLDPARRAGLEQRADADPVLAGAMARQRAGLAAITAAAEGTSAPVALRTRVEAMQREAAAPRRSRVPRLPSLGRWLPAAGLATAAALGLVFVLFLGGGPTADSVLAAAARPPVAAASLDPNQPALLRQEADGVRFPNYAAKFGWQAAGTRTDSFDERGSRTVFYRLAGSRPRVYDRDGRRPRGPGRGEAGRAR